MGANSSGAIPRIKRFGKAPGYLSYPKAQGDSRTAGCLWGCWSPLSGYIPGPSTAEGPDTPPRAGTDQQHREKPRLGCESPGTALSLPFGTGGATLAPQPSHSGPDLGKGWMEGKPAPTETRQGPGSPSSQ